MEEKMENENGHATKQDISQLRSEISQFRSEMNHFHQDLLQRIADRETRLLNAFYAFTESNQKRTMPPAS
jgi:hypothetical protein